jgi:CcmD family protein
MRMPSLFSPLLVCWGRVPMSSPPSRSRRADEFVPMEEVPPDEQIPAINLVAAAYGFVWIVVVGYVWSLGRRLQKAEQPNSPRSSGRALMDIGIPSAAHFIYIPFSILVGVVIGWVLGSRAAQDAFAAELKRRESGNHTIERLAIAD